MRKKIKFPKNFGHGITGQLMEECGAYGFYEFLAEFSREVAKKDKSFKENSVERRQDLNKIKEPEVRKDVEELLESASHDYVNTYLTVGFALGQRLDILESSAQKEIDYIWQRLREEKLFFVYPRDRKAA